MTYMEFPTFPNQGLGVPGAVGSFNLSVVGSALYAWYVKCSKEIVKVYHLFTEQNRRGRRYSYRQ